MLAKTMLKWGLALILLLSSVISFAQKTVTGTVTDANNQPASGATVTVTGTKVATQTDATGNFSISVPAGRNSLTVSFVGFENQIVTIGSQSSLSISMRASANSLSEVVVTGYGSQRKKDITGAVAVVNVANMKQIPTGTPEQALQGQASGVTIVTSGSPGGGSNVRIRGITSIGNSDPLVIVDGTPGSMHDLNVNDIESIQVLKDAGAAAIYGVRGSNGVVVITTKRGKSGKTRVSYDAYYGTQRPLKNGFGIANTTETAQAYYQQAVNTGSDFTKNKQFGRGATTGPVIPDYITPTAGKEGDPNTDPSTYALYTNQITRANKVGTDWFHEIFKPAAIQSHSVSVSAGSEKSSFYFSLGYFNQQGTLINTFLKRYTARINTLFSVGGNNHIRFGENAYVFYRQNPGFTNQNENNAISMSYRESPIIPVYDIMGNYAGTGSQGLGNAQNPVANQQRTANNKLNDWQINGNVFAEVDFLKGLTARTSFGGTVDNYYYNSFSYTAYENAENNKNPNSFTENFGYNSSYTWTNTLTYSNIFGKHTIRAIAGTEAIQNYGRAINGNRSGYYITNPGNLSVDPSLFTLNFGPPTGQTTSNINGTPYQSSLYSLFARIDYSYNDRYLVSGTLRRDGSSVFDPSQRYGYFPSVTGGWRISKEEFMHDITWISDLKLRGGWGKLGSISNINATNAFSLYNQSAANSYYDINGTNTGSVLGIYPNQIGNTKTTWEQDVITNIGIDASIFKSKFDFSVEWYKKAITGLLFRPAAYTGSLYATAPYVNAGNIQNTGIDASATYHGAVHKDLSFDITGTFTSYHNKVVSLPAGVKYYDEASAGSTRIGSFSRLQAGQAVGAFFGYQVVGLFQSAADVSKSPTQQDAAPGRFKYADVNGRDANGNLTGKSDGKIDDADRTFIGNPNPKFSTGFNLAVRYKNFDFSTFLYASIGNDIINYVKYWTDFPQVFAGAVSKNAVYNSWTPQRPNATVPILENSANFSNTTVFNSYYKENGSYLRMKSLVIGYTLPAAALKRFGIERLRIYAQAANLFTITKYTGLDPELTGSDLNNNTNFGIDFGNYPANQKNYNIGVNLSF